MNVVREDRLLEYILRLFAIENDDAAVLEVPEGSVVLKVDSFESELHLLPVLDHRQAGIRAVTSAISDVLVKGAAPKAALISLRVPRNIREESIHNLHEGILEAASRYGLKILGGDTDVAERGSLRLDVFVVGALRGRFLRRRGARAGDLVAITGKVGLSAVLHGLIFSPGSVNCRVRRDDVESFAWGNLPDPSSWLAVKDCITSATDNSDGLALSLYNIADASAVRIVLRTIPLHERLVECVGEETAVFKALYYSGEEYNFVFTVPPNCEEAVRRLGATVIGRVEEGEGVALEEGGEVRRFGWVGGAGYTERMRI